MRKLITSFLLLVLCLNCSIAWAEQKSHELLSRGNEMVMASMYVEAFDCYTQAIELAEEEGDARTVINCLGNIANVYEEFSSFGQAIFYYKKAYQAAMEAGEYKIASQLASNLVFSLCKLGQTEEAKLYFVKQKELPAPTDPAHGYFLLANQAYIAQAEGKYALMEHYGKEAIRYAQQHNLSDGFIASAYNTLCDGFIAGAKVDSAEHYAQELLKLAQLNNMSHYVLSAYMHMSHVSRLRNDTTSEQSWLLKYRELEDSVEDPVAFNAIQAELRNYEDNLSKSHLGIRDEQITRQRTWLWIIIGIALILALAISLGCWQHIRLKKAYQVLYDKTEASLQAPQFETSYPTATPLMTSEAAKELAKGVENIMSNPEITCNPDFSLQTLTEMLKSNTRYVSWVCNNMLECTFKEALNKARVREACRMLKDPDNRQSDNVKTISIAVGFKTPTGFILAFKRQIGMTPGQYRKIALSQVS
ncbi:MAG: helix-turn-helix domain-containing protein [Bacteroidales bacterium]|nr:helix-turn-helix domain-containing protein [Bacteroidales bacterium]